MVNVLDMLTAHSDRQFGVESLAIFRLRVARDRFDHDSTMPIGALDYMASGREASRHGKPLPSERGIVSNGQVDPGLEVGQCRPIFSAAASSSSPRCALIVSTWLSALPGRAISKFSTRCSTPRQSGS